MVLLQSPTDIVWMAGRIQTNGPDDYDFVHQLQSQVTAAPLGQRGSTSTSPGGPVDPSLDMGTPPMIAVDGMNGKVFFTALMEALKKNPPHVHDQGVVARMRRLGLQPGESLDYEGLPNAGREAIDNAPADGLKLIRERAQHLGTENGGWTLITSAIGYFGADYALRAATAMIGLGANRPEDAIIPSATTTLTATRSAAPIGTCCGSPRARPRPWTRSGRSPSTTTKASQWKTRSTVTPSGTATI